MTNLPKPFYTTLVEWLKKQSRTPPTTLDCIILILSLIWATFWITKYLK